MKFKQSHGQNQRFEQITTSYLVVGIDIAKETQIVQASLPIRASTCRGESGTAKRNKENRDDSPSKHNLL